MTIDGDLLATVNAQQLGDSRLIWVGGSLGDNVSTPNFYAYTLPGQVIINGANAGGTWVGRADADAQYLLPRPEYQPQAVTVGGGAIGEAPFHVHNEDCDPPYVDLNSDQVLDPAPFCVADVANGCPIRVRYYGPVLKNAGSTDGWLTYQGPSSLVNVAGTFSLPGGAFNRDVLIDGVTLLAGRTYTFNPGRAALTNPLRCRFVTGVPAVADEPYVFAASSCSPADVGVVGGLSGSDGVLDNNDFVSFISLFFAQDPVADMGMVGGLAGHDNAWDNNDFIVFINYFFNDAAACTSNACAVDPRCSPPPPPGGNFMGRASGGEFSGDSNGADSSGENAGDPRAAFLREMASLMPDCPERDLLLEIAAELESAVQEP